MEVIQALRERGICTKSFIEAVRKGEIRSVDQHGRYYEDHELEDAAAEIEECLRAN
jgi:DNA-binding transcriptional ArsR family regulator